MSPGDAVAAASPARRPTLGLVAILVCVIAGLAAGDRVLEQIERSDLMGSARQAYETGTKLLDAGTYPQAIDSLRNAHALARDNREYEIQLIVALMDAGKTVEAEPLMSEILQQAPNDGRGNLIAARLANEEGRLQDAQSYYHRAIYGEWPSSAAGRRIAARMELIGFLREKGNRQELMAELISLEAEAPPDKATQRTLARLFIAAGAPARAADIYQSLLEDDRKDTAAYAGLGEAELEQGRYRDAHAAFLQAFFHAPQDTSVRSRLQLLNTVMALDPTPRELLSAEKYRRSLRILSLTRDSVGQCAARDSSGATSSGATSDVNGGDVKGLLAKSDAALANKAPARVTNEDAESLLTLAEQMWRWRVQTCGGIPASEDSLRLIMEKLIARS